MDMINAHAQTTLKHHSDRITVVFMSFLMIRLQGCPMLKIHIKAMRMSLHGPGARHGHCMVIQ